MAATWTVSSSTSAKADVGIQSELPHQPGNELLRRLTLLLECQ